MKTGLQSAKRILLIIIWVNLHPASLLAQWSASTKLSLHSNAAQLNENMGRCIDVDGDTVHVVWSDVRSHGSAIYYKRSPDAGVTWNNEVAITDTNGTARMPAIAVSGSTVHVVWLDSSLGHYASFYKRSLDGGNTWSQNFVLDSNTIFWPGVAASGSMVVVSLNKLYAVGNTEVYFRSSMDNGADWGTEQQISNANGRSEDPAIAILDSNIYLSWNDNRSGTMLIYYRHSPDAGATWGPETALTSTNSYTTMVCLYNNHVDIPHGTYPGSTLQVFLEQSADKGSTFAADMQLSSNQTVYNAYPFMVRDSSNLYLVYYQLNFGGWYLHSGDGGTTWDTASFIGNGGEPFIALTGCVLHIIWPDSGAIYYTRNPIGNCSSISTGIKESLTTSELKLYPNPFSNSITVQSSNELGLVTVCNLLGEIIYSGKSNAFQQQIDLSKQAAGVYIVSAQGNHFKVIKE